MKVQISSDSTCDLSRELVEKYRVAIVPLSVIIDGQSYKDGVDVTPEMIFRASEHGKKVQTAAVNQFEYEELFKGLLQENDAVVHFCISNEMSSCYADACKAASRLENVYVVDTRNLSTGSGLLVLEACELAAMGKSAQEIADSASPEASHHGDPVKGPDGKYHGTPRKTGNVKANSIDHIFVEKAKIHVKTMRVILDQDALDVSDHSPIYADFELK